MEPELIVWPEASTPYALNNDHKWVEALSTKTSTPMLIGAVLKNEDSITNTICEILPDSGFNNNHYAKRVLVPFGEYIPFPFRYFTEIRKLVGPVGNFNKGENLNIFSIPRKTNPQEFVDVGPLICYEDIFPSLCVDIARKGVDLFFVSTNNAWFGEEGCAEQHAAHSVMRAVETQRPFIRCGNAGWSGWIDSNGFQREVIRDEEGSIYCARATVLNLIFNKNAKKNNSFYVQNGDLFAYSCLFLTIVLICTYFLKYKE
jgi:apolipoprotein N-acyltransferase